MPVVMLEVLPQHCSEVAGSDDQEMIKAFPTQRADETFRDRVRPRCPDGSADDADIGAGEHGVERGGELAVPVTDQEPERSRSTTLDHQLFDLANDESGTTTPWRRASATSSLAAAAAYT